MAPVLRVLAALALLVLSLPAAARDATPNAPKFVPKLGSVGVFTTAAQLAAMLASTRPSSGSTSHPPQTR